ncbi:MAG: insulinase family protein [Saprospiraceae bacterium]|nr:insulinase family protein [Saprospiraceae bacterium]
MINFEKFILKNGLKVIVHQDTSTKVVAMNILYNVGARDEEEDKTGFAHLFEHLMFGGSINIPKYDEPLEKVGGENNAFTNNDITNYYLTVPKQNIETAFWLESDRMLNLAFSPKSLDVQRSVVIEEFKQVYLNQPYGDAWLLLKPLAYKVHPYKWNTIGKDISHIQNARMEDVISFYDKFYNPSNAIMVVAGDVDVDQVKQLSEKWFGSIENNGTYQRNLPVEPVQMEKRTLKVERDVPFDQIDMTFHMCSRNDKDYYTVDLLSDLLSNGKSSRLYYELVKKQRLFSECEAFITGDIDNGLFIISGKLIKGVSTEKAESAIFAELAKLKEQKIEEIELQKVKNKIESSKLFAEMSVLNKAMNLAYFELLGDAENINTEINKYLSVSSDNISTQAKKIFSENNCSILYYLAKK